MLRKKSREDKLYTDLKYILEYYHLYVNRMNHKDKSYSYVCLCRYGTLMISEKSMCIYHKVKRKDYDFSNNTNQFSTYNVIYFKDCISFILDYFHTLRKKGDPFAKRRRAKGF